MYGKAQRKIKRRWQGFIGHTWVRLLIVVVGLPLLAGATWAATNNGSLKNLEVGADQSNEPLVFRFQDQGRPLVEVGNLRPGDTVTRCLRVTSESTLPADVNLRWQFSGTLVDDLTISAEEGSGNVPQGGSCQNFIPSGVYVHGTNSSGIPVKNLTDQSYSGWAAGVEHVYRFKITVADNPSGQNRMATAGYYLNAAALDSGEYLGLLSPPVVFGSMTIGSLVGTTTGSWRGRPDKFDYQWQRCRQDNCQDIAGADRPAYRLVLADFGATVRTRVVANQGRQQLSAFSNMGAKPVGYGLPLSLSPPRLFGTFRVGKIVRASSGRWLPRDVTIAYQWQRCRSSCANIPRAQSARYKPIAADQGQRLRVVVTATSALGSRSRTSSLSKVVRRR